MFIFLSIFILSEALWSSLLHFLTSIPRWAALVKGARPLPFTLSRNQGLADVTPKNLNGQVADPVVSIGGISISFYVWTVLHFLAARCFAFKLIFPD